MTNYIKDSDFSYLVLYAATDELSRASIGYRPKLSTQIARDLLESIDTRRVPLELQADYRRIYAQSGKLPPDAISVDPVHCVVVFPRNPRSSLLQGEFGARPPTATVTTHGTWSLGVGPTWSQALVLWWNGKLAPAGFDHARRALAGLIKNGSGVLPYSNQTTIKLEHVLALAKTMLDLGLISDRVVRLTLEDGAFKEIKPSEPKPESEPVEPTVEVP